MASRDFDNLQILGKLRKVISGTFFPNGSSAIVAASNLGLGWTVARTGVGVIVVTLQDAYNNFDSAWVKSHSATLGHSAQITSVIAANGGAGVGGSFTLKTYVAGTNSVVDFAAATTESISFGLILKNTSGNF